MSVTADVVVVGGGIIGAASALALAERARRVVLLDQGRIGREASWAGAGILTPASKSCQAGGFPDLAAISHRMYGELAERVAAETGISVEYNVCGMLWMARAEEDRWPAEDVERLARLDIRIDEVSCADARKMEPALAPDLAGGYWFPEASKVRAHRFTRALAEATRRRGGTVCEYQQVTGFCREGDKVTGVQTTRGDVHAGHVVVCAGAWGAPLLRPLGLDLPVRPARGQILLAERFPPMLERVIEYGDEYLVPRSDGRVLIGSSVEHVGFDRSVTLEHVGRLVANATRVVPGLAQARLADSWAGFRPYSPDGAPFIGLVPQAPNVVASVGHFRSGLLLAPVCGQMVADLVVDGKTSYRMDPFRLDRPLPADDTG